MSVTDTATWLNALVGIISKGGIRIANYMNNVYYWTQNLFFLCCLWKGHILAWFPVPVYRILLTNLWEDMSHPWLFFFIETKHIPFGQREIFFALSEAESVYGLGVNLVFLTAHPSPYGIGTSSVILLEQFHNLLLDHETNCPMRIILCVSGSISPPPYFHK